MMYDLPSRDDVAKVIVDADVVLEKVNPTLVPRANRSNRSSGSRPRRAAS